MIGNEACIPPLPTSSKPKRCRRSFLAVDPIYSYYCHSFAIVFQTTLTRYSLSFCPVVLAAFVHIVSPVARLDLEQQHHIFDSSAG